MSKDDSTDREELRRQAKAHIQSLRLAGVEWLPVAESPVIISDQQPLTTHDSSLTTPASQNDPRKALTLLAQEVSACCKCAELVSTRKQTVFGDGGPGVDLCFVGEAPGADEDAQGLPFVGAAGQLLNKIIVACGMKREEVYICNILKCRPPGNRTPLANEAANCREYLDKQLELVQPRFICALGACAAQNLLGTTQSIGRLRGSLQHYKGIPVWCTYHPAYLLRSPEKKRDVWEDMKKLLALMGRPIPKT